MKKKILITGASGLVARFVIKQLSADPGYEIYAVSSRPEVISSRYSGSDNIHSINVNDMDELLQDKYSGSWYVIHGAFTRKNDAEMVVQSLDFADHVFSMAKKLKAEKVIYLSSRSVYKEPEKGCLNTESSPVASPGIVGMSKYAVELLNKAYFEGTETMYTSLRLASVNELKTDLTMVRPLNVFVDRMIAGEDIRVVGGMQVMSYIDPRDIATAIEALLDSKCKKWHDVYNVGTGWMCTDNLMNLAEMVISIGEKFSLKPVNINLEEKQIDMYAGLDITRITADTGWKPQITLEKMIEDLYDMKLNGVYDG